MRLKIGMNKGQRIQVLEFSTPLFFNGFESAMEVSHLSLLFWFPDPAC
jgi:hypothetical protein